MSKIVTFRNRIPIGEQEKLNLKTIKGKVGYKIKKFQAIAGRPGTDSGELVVKVYAKSQLGDINPLVDFSESDLLAVAFYKSHANNVYATSETIIFDNVVVNQNVFITMTDAEGGTDPGNYYIEFETMNISDIEATQLTLKNIRTITSSYVSRL